MAKISEGVYFIQGRDDMIPDSHTYIIGEPSSNDLSIIDVGLTGKGNYKIQSIQKEGIDLSSIKRIIMTHTHLDHIGCIAEIKNHIPWAELWVHSSEGKLLEQGDDRAVYGMDMFKSMCLMQYGLKPDSFKMTVDRKLEGGEVLEIGNMVWEIIHIPGHSMGGIALYSPALEILIPGDVIYADHAIGRFDLFGADAEELKSSLNRLAQLKIEVLLPGHNNIMKDVPSDYVKQVARMWEPYLR
ncbi:MAG TPA: MBL fold metallo-hydrolase [Syntrophorhabdaceae bacterium]|jgi:glyoxylase-like metal-dependent hydrolase (beta-lactamase superfamily II)|nr:MBL fold metallo-hydrolase [Syntrophorhabdaceae bacterium]MDI9561877.1 MBL fold metallo-hydrolase [Pseudomonadota bacterium]OQC50884.1 MAG: putative metallo-hydrolase YflN [Deltaproteobacteria bacterium ADurb.Bin026]MBP8697622.1 MBL fold metallo-hydrolase [Syntrophorhabdaceae bacterium]MBV6505446.1 Hydroxyacylglutathione hydrolase [Syntrophorhabdaceae bacterium]